MAYYGAVNRNGFRIKVKGGLKMSKIEGYGAYQNSYYSTVNAKNAQKSQNADKTDKTDKTNKNGSVNLSDKAKKLLDELKKTYSNMDFIIADYETDEEAAEYLSRGSKEFSVLIDPETLEAMAADEETKNKYIGILEDSVGQLKDIKDQLGEDGDEVKRIGISVGKDGQVSYFAELEKAGERQKEFIDSIRESKKEAKTEQEKKAQEELAAHERTKKTTVSASSIEELLEKIRSVDWDQIKSEERPEAGSRFDFSV